MPNSEASEKARLRQFGLILSLAAVLIGWWPWWFDRPLRAEPFLVSGVLLLWALAAPRTLRPFYRAWMGLGHVLGWINSRVVLGVVFWLVFMPVGLLLKIFAHDPLQRRLDARLSTYRKASVPLPKENMEKPY